MMLDELDKRLIHRLCGDLPTGARPFMALGEELDCAEAEVIERIHRYDRDGIMRRFGTMLRHRDAGAVANAMVVWVVPEEVADAVGEHAASLDEVSHCYQREPACGWPYTLYAMVHAASEATCRAVAAKIAERFGLRQWRVLPTRREFKKSSVRYFGPGVRRDG